MKSVEIKIIAGSFLRLSIICGLRRKCRDWAMQSVKNMTGNEEQHALKLSLRCVEHEDFSGALPRRNPRQLWILTTSFPLRTGSQFLG